MPGILPNSTNGGVIYRTAAGVCAIPANVVNAYCPLPEFTTTCDLTALPSDCTARIIPAQINALVSEMLSFAEGMDPDGIWNCSSLSNLRTAFNAWQASQVFFSSAQEVVDAIEADDNAQNDLLLAIQQKLTYREFCTAQFGTVFGIPAAVLAIGTIGPTIYTSQAIVNTNTSLPLNVAISDSTEFRLSTAAAGTGSQVLTGMARVNAGAYTNLSRTAIGNAAQGIHHLAGVKAGVLSFAIPPAGNVLVEWAVSLETSVAPVTVGVDSSSSLASGQYRAWY